MKKIITNIFAAFIAMSLTAFSPADKPSVTLTIKVKDLKNEKGKILLALYDKAQGFPNDPEKSVRKLAAQVKQGEVVVKVEALPPGEYAVAVVHDENDNGQMDTNLLGIPKESYGMSNDAKGMMGPPSFSDASFEMADDREIVISMR